MLQCLNCTATSLEGWEERRPSSAARVHLLPASHQAAIDAVVLSQQPHAARRQRHPLRALRPRRRRHRPAPPRRPAALPSRTTGAATPPARTRTPRRSRRGCRPPASPSQRRLPHAFITAAATVSARPAPRRVGATTQRYCCRNAHPTSASSTASHDPRRRCSSPASPSPVIRRRHKVERARRRRANAATAAAASSGPIVPSVRPRERRPLQRRHPGRQC